MNDFSLFSKVPALDAMQRTSTAFTVFNSGLKENVNPTYAEITVNHRIHSKQSCQSVNFQLNLKKNIFMVNVVFLFF